MDVTVELMRKGNEDKSGTAIYCQNRLVTDNEHGDVGGDGDAGRTRIGNWSHHNNRLNVIVELTTMGDGSDLPWDAQKSTIDPHHAVSRAMDSWLNRIVTPYFNANGGTIKKAFVCPYGAEADRAANGGEVEVLNDAGKDNVTDKPNDSFDDVTYVMRTAEAYIDEGFKFYGDIDESFIPAFDSQFANNYDPESNDGIALEHVEVRTKEEIDDEERFDLDTQERELANLIADVRGAGRSKKEALMKAGFLPLEDIADASTTELVSVSGVGRRLAGRLREEARSRGDASTEDETDAEQTAADESTDDAASDQAAEGDDEADIEQFDSGGGSSGDVPATDATNIDGAASEMTNADDDVAEVLIGFDREEYDQIRQKLNADEENPDAVAQEIRDLVRRMHGLDQLPAQ